MLTAVAQAKVNLTLEVLGRRDDGYHEIASVMQTIDLGDKLSFQLDDEIRLVCDAPQLASEDNLVVKAARLLQEATGLARGALISLNKGIPISAGLGGGSSDAATTLLVLNELWGLGLRRKKLCEISIKLGSDVVFFLYRGTALVEGSGEKLTPLPSLSPSWLVLLKPPIDVPDKTQMLYAALGPSDFTSGEFTKAAVESIRLGGNIPQSRYYNVFQKVAFSLFPQLDEYERRFISDGAAAVHLAGAGPTLFSMVESKEEGEDICRRLEMDKLEVCLSRTVGNERMGDGW